MSLKRGVTQWHRDRRGASAVVFAICLMPILLTVGFVVDLGMYLNQKTKVQHALDLAGLAAAQHLAKNLSADISDVKTLANKHFELQIDGADYITMNAVTLTRTGMRLNLEVEGTMPTSFMQLVGIDAMAMRTDTEVVYGVPSKAEIALVLDTSNSMSVTDPGDAESRISSLRNAAKDMVTTLIDPSSGVDVKMAIVPFSNRVNVGTSYRSASWISVPADYTTHQTDCYITAEWYNDHCRRDTSACDSDNVSGTCGTWDCTGVDTSSADRSCTSTTRNWSWYGCVDPRSEAYHLMDGFYTAERIPAMLSRNDWQCASEILPLSDDASALNLKIDRMRVRSETYIPSGLIWGYRMLTPRQPFAADKSVATFATEGGAKSIVLMSDGANTLAPDSTGEISDLDISSADPNTREICQTIRDAQIELYVVAYNITDVATSSLLRDCASSDTRFFEAASADQLKDVFEAITEQLARDIAIAG